MTTGLLLVKESVKQPSHHLVGSLKLLRLLHDAARDIGIARHMRLASGETSGGKEFQVGFRHLSVDRHRAEAGAQEGCNLLVLTRGHREIGLREVKGV